MKIRNPKSEIRDPTPKMATKEHKEHKEYENGSFLCGLRDLLWQFPSLLNLCRKLCLKLCREPQNSTKFATKAFDKDSGSARFELLPRRKRPLSVFGLLSAFWLRPSDFRSPLLQLALVTLLAVASGCRRDMFNQPYSKPLKASDFFQDNHMASRPLVPNTVARGQLNEDAVFFTGKLGTNLVATFPYPLTREILERGQERFDIYCAVCHGRTGEGNGMIVQRGFPAPPSYHIDRLRQAPIGHFYDVITQGYGVMYSYAQRVEPADRWAIAAYIRALQLSQNGALEDVPPDQRARMDASK